MGISCGSHRIWVRNNLVAERFRNGAIYLSRMGWCATSTRPWNADGTKAIRTSQLWVRLGSRTTQSRPPLFPQTADIPESGCEVRNVPKTEVVARD
jgi:hypothetical protein